VLESWTGTPRWSRWEEDKAEEEAAEKAVPFTRGNPRRPKHDRYPEAENNNMPGS
jgi:hypothetical protein